MAVFRRSLLHRRTDLINPASRLVGSGIRVRRSHWDPNVGCRYPCFYYVRIHHTNWSTVPESGLRCDLRMRQSCTPYVGQGAPAVRHERERGSSKHRLHKDFRSFRNRIGGARYSASRYWTTRQRPLLDSRWAACRWHTLLYYNGMAAAEFELSFFVILSPPTRVGHCQCPCRIGRAGRAACPGRSRHGHPASLRAELAGRSELAVDKPHGRQLGQFLLTAHTFLL